MHHADWLLAVLAALLCIGCQATTQPQHRFEYQRALMGVQARVVLYAPDDDSARDAASAAFAEIQRLNDIMSDYDPGSELMQLTAHPPGERIPISDDLLTVLIFAQALAEFTDGAFDITVGPLVQLWRHARQTGTLPAPTTLATARARTGWQQLALDPSANTLTFHQPGMQLDLGGIGKGYAAQRATAILRNRGIDRTMIAMAGDIVLGDPPPAADGWAIEIHTGQPGSTPRTLILSNTAISTSGDTAQFIEIDGTRYSHIIDPRTGLGLTSRIAATVIAPDGMTADALASALSVLGLDAGARLAQQWEITAIIEQLDDNGTINQTIIDPHGLRAADTKPAL